MIRITRSCYTLTFLNTFQVSMYRLTLASFLHQVYSGFLILPGWRCRTLFCIPSSSLEKEMEPLIAQEVGSAYDWERILLNANTQFKCLNAHSILNSNLHGGAVNLNEADHTPNLSSSPRQGPRSLGICLRSCNSVSFSPPILRSNPCN